MPPFQDPPFSPFRPDIPGRAPYNGQDIPDFLPPAMPTLAKLPYSLQSIGGLDPQREQLVQDEIQRLGMQDKDWRYIVVNDPSKWASLQQMYGTRGKTETGVTPLSINSTYLNGNAFNRGPVQQKTTIDHEFAHQVMMRSGVPAKDQEDWAQTLGRLWANSQNPDVAAWADAVNAKKYKSNALLSTKK